MKPISIDKLKPFVYQGNVYEDLKSIYGSSNFSIASNEYMIGIIYHSKDHNLHYEPFGNVIDMAISLVKDCHNKRDYDFEITFNRKAMLDVIKEQYQELKAKVKENHNTMLRQSDVITEFRVYCETYKMYIVSFIKNKYKEQRYYASERKLEVDFYPLKKDMEVWKQSYNTKYIITLLNFFTGYENLTFYQDGHPAHPVRCEMEDREVLLLPYILKEG